jgi:hypothetical protein
LKSGDQGSSVLLRLLCLAGLFAAAGLLFTYAVWPVLLWPFTDVLARSPLAGLLGLAPCLLVRDDSSRRQGAKRLHWSLTGWLDALSTGFLIGAFLAIVQIAFIKAKRFLTLDQYLEQQVWVLWIAMLLLGAAYGLLLFWWARLRRRPASS